MAKKASGGYYAVANGRNTGVYRTWSDCQAQVDHHSGAVFKRFDSALAAQSFISTGVSSSRSSGASAPAPKSTSTSSSSSYSSYGGGYGGGYSGSYSGGFSGGSSLVSSSSSKPTSSRSTIHSTPSLKTSTNSYNSAPSQYRKSASSVASLKPVVVYTDGACRGNGQKPNCESGYGVYYPGGEKPDALVPISSGGTNQRAELMAVKHALTDAANDLASGSKPSSKYEIRSDSKYAIDSITKYSEKWSTNGYKSATGGEVKNQDILRDIIPTYNYVNSKYGEAGLGQIDLVHVNGHSGEAGNDRADKLANEGADLLK